MKKSQLVVVLAAVAAVALIAVISGQKGRATPTPSPSTRPAGLVDVTLASSPEKLTLMQRLARDFNATHPKVAGRPVAVTVRSASSGDEEIAIARASQGKPGGDRPVVWSPASSLWTRLLQHDADAKLVADTNPSIVRSPLVLATWEPLARALGYPGKPLGFADVLRLATDPRGWAAYGHPEYGPFKLVHTNPGVSTSGLEAVAAEYFAATGKKEGLTVADVDRPAVRKAIAAIEQSIVHYGDTTLYISQQLQKNGPAYASMVAMEETTLVQFNRDRKNQPKLVAIYPREGTFHSDSPYVILRTPWVDAAERSGAQAFQRYIAAHLTPGMAAQYGFRPADVGKAPLAPIDAAHGADPRQPARVLGLPDPAVLSRIREAWLQNRKPANIELVLDTSGSMSDNGKLAQAKQGLSAFLGQLSPRDRVGLLTFSSDVVQRVPIRPYAKVRDRLRGDIDGLLPDGETAVYDATAQAVANVAASADSRHINAVVVLTDGQDTTSTTDYTTLLAKVAAHTGSEATAVRVFTIAYGVDADQNVLEQIAAASNGRAFVGSTGNIDAVYRSISSFF